MKKYIVVSLSVLGMNNCLFYTGTEVMENAFPEGHADKLTQEGHLRLVEESTGAVTTNPNVGGESDPDGTGGSVVETAASGDAPLGPGKVKARKGEQEK